MTLANRVGRLKARSSMNGLEPSMLIIGQAEQAALRADVDELTRIGATRPNVEQLPDSYQGLVLVRVAAPSLLMVGNVTVEQ
jgi:hypothetical protein